MKTFRPVFVAILLLMIGLATDALSAKEGLPASFLGTPQFEKQDLYPDERFPNIVVTTRGTLLATWGSENIRVRRSEDGGKTWQPALTIVKPGFHGGGTTVDENTGDILVFVEERHPPAPITISRSRDDGRTWAPEKFVVKLNSLGHAPSMHMNEKGITLAHGKHKGRLIRPSRYYGAGNHRTAWPEHYTNATFSDDSGKTWQNSEPFPEQGTGEACIVELSDGRLYYNSRIHWDQRPKNTRRRAAWSADGGRTWKDWRIVEVLPDGDQHRAPTV